MRRVIWSEGARRDVLHIHAYIAQFDEVAANRTRDRLVAVAQGLEDFPEQGRQVGRNVRQLSIVWPYLTRYRVHPDHVEILTVRHGARGRR